MLITAGATTTEAATALSAMTAADTTGGTASNTAVHATTSEAATTLAATIRSKTLKINHPGNGTVDEKDGIMPLCFLRSISDAVIGDSKSVSSAYLDHLAESCEDCERCGPTSLESC